MNSFYGGREGAPFIIRKRYNSILDMTADFERGLSNTEVRYGEYVIINTKDRNHPDNGKVFRRNFIGGKIESYQDKMDESGKYIERELKDGNGAEFIGTIVGPAGPAPHFQPVPFTAKEPVFGEDGEVILDEKGEPVLQDKDYNFADIIETYKGYDTTSGYGSFNIPDGNLVPGKDGDKFNDEITWLSYSVRSENADDATAFIEFKMPYHIIEFDSKSVSPYYNRSNQTATFDNQNLVKRHDDQKHPFYQKWELSIPKGIHGASIENFRIENVDGNAVLKYDIRNYDTNDSPSTVASHILGDYKVIENSGISIDEEGTITIPYTHGADTTYNQLLTWITGVSLSDEGVFEISTNNNKHKLSKDLHWVKNIDFDEEGTVTLTDVDGTTTSYNELITWIKAWSFDPGTGELYMVLNNDSHLAVGGKQITRIPMRTVQDILVENGSKFVLQYNTVDPQGNNHTKDLGCFIHLGEEKSDDLMLGGLWVKTIEV